MELADSTFFQRCDVISHQVGHANEDGAVTFAGQLVLDWNGWLDPTILALPLDDLASDRLLSDSGSRQIRASGTPIFTLALAFAVLALAVLALAVRLAERLAAILAGVLTAILAKRLATDLA